MPYYDYKCKECSETKTLKLGMTEPRPESVQCDSCKNDMIRVYSNIGVTFNGSGFYSKDK